MIKYLRCVLWPLQTGTLRCCAVQKDQLEALSSLHADAVNKYRLHEESRVIMEVCCTAVFPSIQLCQHENLQRL